MVHFLTVLPGMTILRDSGLVLFGALALWTAGIVQLYRRSRGSSPHDNARTGPCNAREASLFEACNDPSGSPAPSAQENRRI